LIILFLLLVGVVSGLTAGLLGVGGGLIFLPLAQFYYIDHLGYPTDFLKILIGTSSAIIVSNSLSATILHHRKRNIDTSLLPWFAIACVLGSGLGVLLTDNLPVDVVRCILSTFLIISAIRIYRGRQDKAEDEPLTGARRMQIGAIGVGISTLSSMLGLGGGALMIPVLNVMYLQPIRRAIGTASLFTFTVSATACFYYLLEPVAAAPFFSNHVVIGHVDLQIAGLVALGGIAGTWIGTRMLHRWRVAFIQKIFAILLVVAAVKMLW
jgi:uncharacterized protein